MKREHKQHAKYHLGDMKMNFLAAVVSGIDKHLTSPKGTILFSRLNDQKRNDRFRNHILDEFAKRSADSLSNIEHEEVASLAQSFQNRYLNAAKRTVGKVEKQGEDLNHHQLLSQTFEAFDKVHEQLIRN
ncbi:MAG: hypothetical protein KC535_05580 [Nanoarchaeota archaeon]|nr:hypothetical protein [Nanoarchaeota archaeon]